MTLKPSGRKRPGPPTLKQLKDRKTMSKINLDTVLTQRNGRPLLYYVAEGETDVMTLRTALFQVIDTPMQEDDKSETRGPLMRVGMKLSAADDTVELSKEECTTVLTRARKQPNINTNLYTQIVQALDPDQLKAA